MKTLKGSIIAQDRLNTIKYIWPYPRIKLTQKQFIQEVLTSNQTLFFSTKTGVGKSAALLTSLMALKKPHQKIVIFVRTKAQINVFLRELALIYRQVLKNWKQVEEHFEHFPFILPVLGKNELCLKKRNSLPSEIYSHICEFTSCPLKNKTKRLEDNQIRVLIQNCFQIFPNMLVPDDIYNFFTDGNLCPYFFSHILVSKADILIASYPFLENLILFKTFLYRLGCDLSDLLIAIDEAHNLYAPLNPEISLNIVKKANTELPHNSFQTLLNIGKDEQLVELAILSQELKDLGSILLPQIKSHISSDTIPKVNAYLAYYFLLQAQGKTVISDTKKLTLVNPLPSDVLSKIWGAARIILMSGSFEPVTAFQKLYALPHSNCLRIFPSKDEEQSRAYILMNKRFMGKYLNRTETYYIDICKAIRTIHQAVPGHMLVFASSYNYLHNLQTLTKVDFDIVEEPKIDISFFKTILLNSSHKLVGCVIGGKISEGIEFTSNGKSLIEAVVVCTLPYPPPSIEKEFIFDELKQKFGSKLARDFTISIPTAQRLAQSFGRAIRSGNDKAVHVLLDPRGTRFNKDFHFQRYYNAKMMAKSIHLFLNK